MSQNPQTYAHGVQHTRPIVARGVHTNAANDGLTGRPMRDPQVVTPEGARRERAYWRAYARNCGECPECGMRGGRHEDGCRDAPEVDEEAEEA